MRPRLAWKRPAWSTGAFAPVFAELRALYGLPIAEQIEMCAAMVKDALEQPTSQDMKHTLKRLADRAAASVVARVADDDALRSMVDALDDGCHAALLGALIRDGALDPDLLHRFKVGADGRKVPDLLELGPVDLADCAKRALAAWDLDQAGRRSVDHLVLPLVRTLLGLGSAMSPAQSPAQRDELIEKALRACKVGHSPQNVRRLIVAAKRD